MGPLGFALMPGRSRPRAGAAFDFAGSLPAGATLSRASAGTCWSGAGALTNVGADVARFDHDPLTGSYRGLLIEAAATNLTPYATDASQADWQAVNMTKVSGQADPLGGTGAARFEGDGANTFHGISSPYAAVTAGTTYTLSRFVKPVGASRIQMFGRPNSFDPAALANFQLSGTGSVTAANACTAAIRQLSGGWYRLSVTAAATATVSDSRVSLYLIQDGGDGRTPSFVTSDAFLSTGLQVEVGGTATSLVVTGAATATRAADVLTLNWGARGVADGAITVRYTFDDGSSQDVATTVAGGAATVPVTLNRGWLRRAEQI